MSQSNLTRLIEAYAGCGTAPQGWIITHHERPRQVPVSYAQDPIEHWDCSYCGSFNTARKCTQCGAPRKRSKWRGDEL